jgi:hypothetical protein
MVSKANYTGFINGIMKCILVTILIGASHVPSLLFSVSVFPCLCQMRQLLLLWWCLCTRSISLHLPVYFYLLLVCWLSGCECYRKMRLSR